MGEPLLLLGASVRAAAQSAARLGLTPICGDLFGDADLPDVAIGQVARSFPGDLIRIAAEAPAAPWLYTGGLENHPRVVATISQTRQLYGNPANILRRVRNPFELERVLSEAGLPCAACRDFDDPPPRDSRWLRKHRRSSAGLRVEPWLGEAASPTTRGHYFQRLIDGTPLGAVYVAAAGCARLMGVSEQLLAGNAQLPFRYGGSIAPAPLSDHQRQHLDRLGNTLAGEFQLCGLFGVDLISAADGLWAIEVNPRYTASVEVLERVYSMNAIAIHVAACRDGSPPIITDAVQPRYWGKRIVYAERSQQMNGKILAGLRRLNVGTKWPVVADLPRVGTLIEAEHPAVTIFAEGTDRAIVRGELVRQTAELRDQFAV